ncbi:hypothetical protein RF11_12728 [Thelohanellus kitauei]|uniref:Uncharacterized protein n=1 Tax=Thelohanellus kitauei TaxID=669202 RepID=A0A0C2MC94_THEKT|nr:hypothetical protein RF11_12728 [Thelohanellus kitauei]
MWIQNSPKVKEQKHNFTRFLDSEPQFILIIDAPDGPAKTGFTNSPFQPELTETNKSFLCFQCNETEEKKVVPDHYANTTGSIIWNLFVARLSTPTKNGHAWHHPPVPTNMAILNAPTHRTVYELDCERNLEKRPGQEIRRINNWE